MRDVRQFSRALKELMPDIQFYWSMQEGVKLTPPFTLLDILNDEMLGMGEHSSTTAPRDPSVDADYVAPYAETREVTVRVSFYGSFNDPSYGNARYLMALFKSAKGRSALKRQGLSYAGVTQVRRVDVSGDTTAYINSYFDITLRYKSIFEIELEPMEQVEVTHHLTVETDLGDPDDVFTVTGTNIYTR